MAEYPSSCRTNKHQSIESEHCVLRTDDDDDDDDDDNCQL